MILVITGASFVTSDQPIDISIGCSQALDGSKDVAGEVRVARRIGSIDVLCANLSASQGARHAAYCIGVVADV